jgi:hypothetical protein
VYMQRVRRMGRCVGSHAIRLRGEGGGRQQGKARQGKARQGKAMRCDGRIRECAVLSCHVCLLRPLYCLHMHGNTTTALHCSVSHSPPKASVCLVGTTQRLPLFTHRVIIQDSHLSSAIPSPIQPCGVFILTTTKLFLQSLDHRHHTELAPYIHVPSRVRLHNIVLFHCSRQHNIAV